MTLAEGCTGYAWSENTGWINFGTNEGNVQVSDSSLTGYAWGENIGWISLNCLNDNSCSIVDYKVSNDGEGNLSGYAWSENTGWINFNPANGGVTIDSDGNFAGYAWGENIGWIIFNCMTTDSCSTVDYKVTTDWRPRSARAACNNSLDDDGDGKIDYPDDPGCSSLTDNDELETGGGLLPQIYNPPTPPFATQENPEGNFKILINNGAKSTNDRRVILRLFAGADVGRMTISNNPDLQGGTGQIPFQDFYSWDICYGKKECSDQNYTVYARFYTRYGVASGVVSDDIALQTTSQKSTVELSIKEIKEKIQSLLKIINNLKSQIQELLEFHKNYSFQRKTAVIPKGYSFTKDLSLDQRGTSVEYLQVFLKSQGPEIYPEGLVTGWFGPLTRKAVVRFQEKYAKDILNPLGLVKGTGYVGESTRAKINEILNR